MHLPKLRLGLFTQLGSRVFFFLTTLQEFENITGKEHIFLFIYKVQDGLELIIQCECHADSIVPRELI